MQANPGLRPCAVHPTFGSRTRPAPSCPRLVVSASPASASESALLAAARNRDEAAFADLMRLHYERVFRLVHSILRHEADARDVC